NRTPEMEALNKTLEAMTPEQFSSLPPLTDDDHRLIGIYIQLYNSMDFNLRRAIELFALAKLLPSDLEKKYPRFQHAELASTAGRVVEKMDSSIEDIPHALHQLKEIERGRSFRNLMGHFSAKRFPDKEIVVFVSKDERDAERVQGRRLAETGVLTAMAPVK